jgi:hypothetical protein
MIRHAFMLLSLTPLVLFGCTQNSISNPTPNPVPPNAFRISPLGHDDADCKTVATACKTFFKAFSVMRGGDLLIVGNGTYKEEVGASRQPPAGSAEKLTIIRAETDGGAIIDMHGEGTPLTITASHIAIEGMKFINGSESVGELNGNFIQVRRSAFGNAGPGEYHTLLSATGNDILIEDSWLWGRGNGVLIGSGDNTDSTNTRYRTTLRRVVIRLDSYVGTRGYRGVVMYNASDVLLENVIALDFNPTTMQPQEGTSGFRSRYMNDTGRTQRFYGTIALHLPYDGYDMADSDYENVIAWDLKGRGMFESGPNAGHRIRNATVGQAQSDGIQPYATDVSNSLIYQVGGSSVGGDYNAFFRTVLPSNASNAISSDPKLKYITRIETDSPAFGTGAGGGNRGATVVNRYENGVLTNQPLWPWPNEARIKTDFQTDFGLAGVNPKRGFATDSNGLTGKPISLTSYIWEYLGNPCPDNICR